MDRLFPVDLFRGHFKVLADRDTAGKENRRWVRIVLACIVYLVPIVVGLLMIKVNTTLHSPGALLTATSLLSGGSLSAFTHVSSLRQRLTDRRKTYENADGPDRSLIDESATHLLMCAVAAMLTATSIIIGMLSSHAANAEYSGLCSGISIGLATWTGIIFWIAIPRLYSVYVQMHAVDDTLNGAHRN